MKSSTMAIEDVVFERDFLSMQRMRHATTPEISQRLYLDLTKCISIATENYGRVALTEGPTLTPMLKKKKKMLLLLLLLLLLMMIDDAVVAVVAVVAVADDNCYLLLIVLYDQAISRY